MKVKFTGATNAQVNFGKGGKDPRDYLQIGEVYDLDKKEVHSWYTFYYIWTSVSDKDKMELTPFNSVCFEEIN